MTNDPLDQIADALLPSGLYREVLVEFDRIAASGEQTGDLMQTIGLRAWSRLTPEQRRRDWPNALASYVHQVMDEENAKQMDRVERTVTSYLRDHDVVLLTDALHSVRDLIGHGIEVELEVDAQSLANVLDELELLQHRLAMLRDDRHPAD